jgi:predicted AAA+ superfamily ATPase
MGAVQVLGPKWCGKTTTAERVAKDVISFQDPDRRVGYLQLAAAQPSALLTGAKPLLLDEWQDAPTMWDAVRFAVDRDPSPGQYILTGSSVPRDDEIRHSGTGRFARVVMRPMSLFESGESTGEVALADLFRRTEITGRGLGDLRDLARAVCRGGWPAAVVASARPDHGVDGYDGGRELASDYVDSIVESDVSRIDGIEKNPRRVRLLMRSLARNESSEAALTTVRADMAADEARLSTNTIAVYLAALRRLYVVDDQDAWMPAVRSKAAIRTSPVRRFCDPSIAASLLGLTPDKLMVDFATFGLLFESLCVRDLRAYADAAGAGVFHYRDARGLECDAIVELPDGRWGAVEVKLDVRREDEAAATLLNVQRLVRSQHGGPPVFLAVVTGRGHAYQRTDGVYSVPITALRP